VRREAGERQGAKKQPSLPANGRTKLTDNGRKIHPKIWYLPKWGLERKETSRSKERDFPASSKMAEGFSEVLRPFATTRKKGKGGVH